jgi:hypothetical protein
MAKKKTQSRKKTHGVVAHLPKGYKKRPFTLMWVEKAAAERLKRSDLVFSERVKGLSPSSFRPVVCAAEPMTQQSPGNYISDK